MGVGPRTVVLVVDDHAITRELLDHVLTAGSYHMIAAGTGDQALLTLCKLREQINWLVTRPVLPGLICGWILKDQFQCIHPARPVVMLGERPDQSCPKDIYVPATSPYQVLETLRYFDGTPLGDRLPPAGSRANLRLSAANGG